MLWDVVGWWLKSKACVQMVMSSNSVLVRKTAAVNNKTELESFHLCTWMVSLQGTRDFYFAWGGKCPSGMETERVSNTKLYDKSDTKKVMGSHRHSHTLTRRVN